MMNRVQAGPFSSEDSIDLFISFSLPYQSINTSIPAMTSPSSALPRKLWEHANPESTEMWAFKQKLEAEKGLQFPVRVTFTT